ncbi:MAG: phosphate acyltransferase PlsX [Leptospirales bacterium]|nr:phosphate acyltransferase PlsX [Leptospirales bacterium]
MWIAVDCMSAELGVDTAVHGAIQAVREFGSRVLLVGDEAQVGAALARFPGDPEHIQVAHSEGTIEMHESPARAVRQKRNASIMVAARLVKEGRASAFFSPGNTGATMAAALWELGRIEGVERPAIATALPRQDGGATVLIDSGANVDCKPEWLIQFAIMGEVYAREILSLVNPRVALLSNGEENKKGDYSTQTAHRELLKLPYNFIGNIEGRDLYGGTGRTADVVVCDGFVGNIVLKATEGLARSIFGLMRREIESTTLGRTGAFMLKPTFQMIRARMDYSEYGGAPLLGVNGNCLIGHGSSNARAFKNAVRAAQRFAEKDLSGRITESIRRFGN